MSVVTSEERASILQEMEDLLKEYDYEYTEDALNKIIDEWADKKKGFIEVFKKHPQYVDGKFMIVFKHSYTREFDNGAVKEFKYYIDKVMWEVDRYLNAEINRERIKNGCMWLPGRFFNFVSTLENWASSRTISQGDATMLNENIPELHVHVGEKTSRVVNRLFNIIGYDKHPDYNKQFAKFADAFSPITINRTMVLSVHPIDYLTMSFGNSWSSCQTIDKTNKRRMDNGYHGLYSSGTISYMLDNVSMVSYTVDPEYKGDKYFLEPKITRQMFHYGEDKLVQGRLYPQSNDDNKDEYAPYRNTIQEIIALMFEFPNLWTTHSVRDYRKYFLTEGTHYADYNRYSMCKVSIVKNSHNENAITIGSKPICISCGERHMHNANLNHCLVKDNCCVHCGHFIDPDNEDEYGHVIDGNLYCDDCVSYCEDCDEYYLPSQGYYHDSYGFVCNSCLENRYIQCEECGEYEYRGDKITTADGKQICHWCANEKYKKCIVCGEYHLNDDMIFQGGFYICKKCKEEKDVLRI